VFERRLKIPHRGGDGLYGHLYSIGHTIDLDDEDLIRIIDSQTDEFMQDIRDSRGGWDSMKDWMDQRWPKGWSDDLGSRFESLPLHIAYAAAGFGADAEDIAYFEREELDPFLSRVFSQFEDLVGKGSYSDLPPEISLTSNSWRWKRGVDHWSEGLTVPTNLFQIEPTVFQGWEIILHGVPVNRLINRHYV
jgi:hypothetical protein